jgi:NTE family protein
MSEVSWKRALVLGGGGMIGAAWEAGLCRGLFERGVDLRDCDAFVGTSAGAITCSQLAAGELPRGPDSPPRQRTEGADVDPSRIDMKAFGKAFTKWSQIQRTTPADAREIGLVARVLYRDTEADWIQGITAVSGGPIAWPKKPFFITAVDTESGERVAFDSLHGVEIGRAIAASAAVPGIFASVEIDGKLYMDGQVHSSTHADLLLNHPRAKKAAEVIIAMPTNSSTAVGIGAHAEREVAAEIELLKAAGCIVRFVTPTAEHAARLGNNVMDAKKMPDAYAVGLEAGHALAAELKP